MAYSPTNWTNFPSTATPVNASNLNKIENELVELDTGKADESAVTTALAEKVDKVEGKGLSTEDFTTAEKTKLAGISAEANKVEITPVVTEGTTLATISIDGVDTDIKGSDIDVDSTLSPVSPNPVQNKVITVALEDKADKDGNYEDMAVGQLLSNTFEEDKVPYNFRTSGGTLEIGDREYDTLVGGTVAFNQLFPISSAIGTTVAGITFTNNNDGSYTMNGTWDNTALNYWLFGNYNRTDEVFRFIANHVYITHDLMFYYSVTSKVSYTGIDKNILVKFTTDTVISGIKTANPQTASQIFTNHKIYPCIIDLTQMFGSTIADYIYSLEQATTGSGVAYFRSLFPKDYYDYNAGQLMSVKALSHKMVGFNQWDEEWEVGTIAQSNGANVVDNTKFRSKNFIKVFPNTTYYMKHPAYSIGIRIYDDNKNYVSYTNLGTLQYLLTTTDKWAYIRFVADGENEYHNNICINLHWDGERDREYEPYEEHIYPLDSDLELRGIPKLDANNKLYYDGDTYESDGTVTRRYGIVDLGTLNWITYDSVLFMASLPELKYVSGNNNIICAKYTTSEVQASVNVKDKEVYTRTSSGVAGLGIKDSAYSTAADFKAAVSGVYLVYELATPTTETADTFQNLQLVDNWGTEEYTDSREVQIPVGHITKYPPDLKAKLESAPDSPASDGDYILRHNNGENSYVALTKELPALPTTDGTYVLKATVSSGTATLSWVAE